MLTQNRCNSMLDSDNRQVGNFLTLRYSVANNMSFMDYYTTINTHCRQT